MKQFVFRCALFLATLSLIMHPFFVWAGGGLALTGAIVSGQTLTLTYNEPLDPSSISDVGTFMGDFVVDVNSASVGLQNIALGQDTVVVTLSNPVMVSDAVTISYTPNSNPLTSLSGDQATSFSNQAVATTPSAPFPTNSSSLNPTVVSSSEIDLPWSGIYDGGSAITGYEILRSEGGGPGGGTNPYVPIAHVWPSVTTFADTGLAPGTQYNYEIIASNAIGTGTPLVQTDIATDALFSGGDGSPSNPFQITTCVQFEELTYAQPVGAYFLLENDLDCTSVGNAVTIDTPPYFMGRIDGGGHRITIATTDGEGLIHETGSLFTLKNLWVAGTITGGALNTGGVVDDFFGGTISQVKSTVSVTGSGNIGGIVGNMALPSATISDAYFNGEIHGMGDGATIGGIAGRVPRGQYIKNAYSAGTITEAGSNAIIGGIIGFSPSTFAGYAANDFSTIAMSATGTNETIGGLFGSLGSSNVSYSNDFWDVTRTGQSNCLASGPSVPGCNPENTNGADGNYFKNNATNGPFTSWDFSSIWEIASDGYPELRVIFPAPPSGISTPVPVAVTATLIFGCKDPSAINYNPNNGVVPQNSSCVYTKNVNIPATNIATGDTNTSITFTKNLKKGMTDSEVAQLQKFLDIHGTVVATTGPGSLTQLSTYFGAKTKAALAQYQVSVGLPGTGYFGPKTMTFVNGQLLKGK